MTPPPMTTTRARAGSSGATGALSQTASPDSSADPCHFPRWRSQTNRRSEADAPGDPPGRQHRERVQLAGQVVPGGDAGLHDVVIEAEQANTGRSPAQPSRRGRLHVVAEGRYATGSPVSPSTATRPLPRKHGRRVSRRRVPDRARPCWPMTTPSRTSGGSRERAAVLLTGELVDPAVAPLHRTRGASQVSADPSGRTRVDGPYGERSVEPWSGRPPCRWARTRRRPARGCRRARHVRCAPGTSNRSAVPARQVHHDQLVRCGIASRARHRPGRSAARRVTCSPRRPRRAPTRGVEVPPVAVVAEHVRARMVVRVRHHQGRGRTGFSLRGSASGQGAGTRLTARPPSPDS